MSSTLAFAQQGRLRGKVYEKGSREPIAFANIVVEVGGSVVGGATSNFDGEYDINPIPPGRYDLKATFVGYQPVHITNVQITGNQITFYDIQMDGGSIDLETVEIIEYKIPLISKDQTTSGASITSEEISKCRTARLMPWQPPLVVCSQLMVSGATCVVPVQMQQPSILMVCA